MISLFAGAFGVSCGTRAGLDLRPRWSAERGCNVFTLARSAGGLKGQKRWL